MIRKIGLGFVLLLPLLVQAIDQLKLNVGTITGDDWHLQGIRFDLNDINKTKKTVSLLIEKMHLPEPLSGFTLLDINCPQLQLNDYEIHCRQGVGVIKSKWLDAAKVTLSFHITPTKKQIKVEKIGFAGGTIAIDAEQNQDDWQFTLKGTGIDIVKLATHFPVAAVDVSAGRIDFDVRAETHALEIKKLDINAELTELSLQTQDARYACENLTTALTVQAHRDKRGWLVNNQAHFSQGAVYLEPVYLDLADNAIDFNSQGHWHVNDEILSISKASYNHQTLGVLSGNLVLNTKEGMVVEDADLRLTTNNTEALSNAYILPFFAATNLEGLSFSGALDLHLTIVQQALTNIGLKLSTLDINDEQNRVVLKQGAGRVNWSNKRSNESQTQLSWEQLNLLGIPIAAATLSLNTDAGSIELNQRATLSVLGGMINIEHFSWYKEGELEPDVHFAGSIDEVSLQRLSTIMAWPPLYGTISGTIPGVRYTQGRLFLEGALNARVFDGEIQIRELSSKGLFKDFSEFHVDIEWDNLDLKQISHTFDFGEIEGRLSGYIRDLYLENWQPVSFDAWLGTPKNDDSRHRISQQAVNNISSIGGGGAANILSRTVLRFFDDFSYDRLGIACLMQKGVCYMQGVAPVDEGYYIVKGGGLPRIDVIGYNSQVDWQVLLARLKRITGSDEVVIE